MGPDLNSNVWHSDSVPERIIFNLKKKVSRLKQKHAKLPSMQQVDMFSNKNCIFRFVLNHTSLAEALYCDILSTAQYLFNQGRQEIGFPT